MKINHILFLIASSLLLFSCQKAFLQPEPENNPEALFENLWTTFDTDYAGFEARGVDWDEQYSIYRPQVDAQTTDAELFDVCKQMLRSLDDGHVFLTVPDQKVFNSNLIYDEKIDDELFDLDLIKNNYLASAVKESEDGGSTYGRIGDVGYVHLAWISDNLLLMNEILDEFADTKGLIIDMRHNGGGDFTYAYSEFGRFTDQERYTHRSKTKNGVEAGAFTEWYNWNIYPEGTYFNKPLVLLTDRYTISAGERTVMAFKTLPNLTHMGDTTNGAHSTLIGKELANGWAFTIAPQVIEFNDGKTYEGIGMIPDVVVKNTPEEMNAGQDKTLEAALARF